MRNLQTFDVARYLDCDEAIAEYLSQVMQEGDADEIVAASGHVIRAKGVAQVARDAWLGQKSLN